MSLGTLLTTKGLRSSNSATPAAASSTSVPWSAASLLRAVRSTRPRSVERVDAITGVLRARTLGRRTSALYNTIAPGMVETEGTHTAGIIGSDFEKATVALKPRWVVVGQPTTSPPTSPSSWHRTIRAGLPGERPDRERWGSLISYLQRLICLQGRGDGSPPIANRHSAAIDPVLQNHKPNLDLLHNTRTRDLVSW